LPQSPEEAGPWSRYAIFSAYTGQGWGTINYNHAYVAAQVIMLAGFRIHLGGANKVLLNNLLLVTATITCFLTGSRNGLATILLLAGIYGLRNPLYGAVALLITAASSVLAFIWFPSSLETLGVVGGSMVERQGTLLSASDPENLAGRDEIWLERLDFLDAKPIRWFVGTGFGSALDSGNYAHMLPLHLILETGIIGLILFVFLFFVILRYLYQLEIGDKGMFWTTVVFLFSTVTQETFYPVPAFGQFMGFYLCAVAIALRQPLIYHEISHPSKFRRIPH
jgi:O-antigen ligase